MYPDPVWQCLKEDSRFKTDAKSLDYRLTLTDKRNDKWWLFVYKSTDSTASHV